MGYIYEFKKDGVHYVAVKKNIDVILRWFTWVGTLLILFFLAQNVFVYATHIDEMRTSPIEYGIRESAIDSCICESKYSQLFINASSTEVTIKKDAYDGSYPNILINNITID